VKLVLVLIPLIVASLSYPSVSLRLGDDFSTDAALKATILRELPQWDHFSDFEKVDALRHWAAPRIDMSSSSLFLSSNESFHFFTQNVSAIFHAFQHNWGGVWCGGAAWTLRQLYLLFGYDAHYLNSGMAPACAQSCPTHAETLVRIDVRGTEVLSVQDAYFDITYVDKYGNPLDYLDMLSLLQKHRHEEIRIIPSPDHEFQRDLILRANETSLTISGWLLVTHENFAYLGNSTLLYKTSVSIASYESASPRVRQFFREVLARDGHPQQLIYLHLYPFQVDRISVAPDLYTTEGLTEVLGDLDILKQALDVSHRHQEPTRGRIPQRETELLQLVAGTTVLLVVSAFLYIRWRNRKHRISTVLEGKSG